MAHYLFGTKVGQRNGWPAPACALLKLCEWRASAHTCSLTCMCMCSSTCVSGGPAHMHVPRLAQMGGRRTCTQFNLCDQWASMHACTPQRARLVGRCTHACSSTCVSSKLAHMHSQLNLYNWQTSAHACAAQLVQAGSPLPPPPGHQPIIKIGDCCFKEH